MPRGQSRAVLVPLGIKINSSFGIGTDFGHRGEFECRGVYKGRFYAVGSEVSK
jgi:hypothetical protein